MEVNFAPTIAVSRYENGGPVMHVAKRGFADNFTKYDFSDFANTKIANPCEGLAF